MLYAFEVPASLASPSLLEIPGRTALCDSDVALGRIEVGCPLTADTLTIPLFRGALHKIGRFRNVPTVGTFINKLKLNLLIK